VKRLRKWWQDRKDEREYRDHLIQTALVKYRNGDDDWMSHLTLSEWCWVIDIVKEEERAAYAAEYRANFEAWRAAK
jgi:hypothetical protein